MVDYDTRLHAVYTAGRQLTPEAQHTWMETFARHLPESRPLTWLDLGSGTGRMTPALADAFGGPAHGVEPSDKMRAQAPAQPAVIYTPGSAEHIPLPDTSCDAALLFYVWHHVPDHETAARELHRVVKPAGTLFVVTNFSDHMPDVWWFRVLPEWRKADQAQFQPEKHVTHDFTNAGWTLTARDEVTWLRSPNLAEDYEKLKLRAVSVFEHLTDEATQAGFATIEAALPTLDSGPQYETSTLLVFQR
jgi:ubiquinone/menaquinone biosynthesis C-methylase UbiE